ncbi:MAG: tRNA (adenosine(37)-N6)-threonylcarbamoyltransferase complex ATPase subunit type 1 TsaE [Candidatus Paceibacterota bacterium]|jgi:tRNA threonylcarbamoyladenosine biosynthesis protein TsaE
MEAMVKTLEELDAEVERFIGVLSSKEGGATLVTLSGDLGAGKTAFTKAVARILGVEETVTSPTFVLEKIYQLGGPAPKFKRLVHIDAYRLESGDDLAPLGFDELMQDSSNLILLEWPEKVADALPAPDVKISFVVHTDESRTISYG